MARSIQANAAEEKRLFTQGRPTVSAWLAWLAQADPNAATVLDELAALGCEQEALARLLIDLHALKFQPPPTRPRIVQALNAVSKAHRLVAALGKTQAGRFLVAERAGLAAVEGKLRELAKVSRRRGFIETHFVARLLYYVHRTTGLWHHARLGVLIPVVTRHRSTSMVLQQARKRRYAKAISALHAQMEALAAQRSSEAADYVEWSSREAEAERAGWPPADER